MTRNFFLAVGALARVTRRGLGFQRGLEKFPPLRVWVRRNSDFLWELNKESGIDRSAVVMDTSICAFESPILSTLSLSFLL